jgi:phosphoribosyl 1,2-cyclic phosphate phosphodiesterase
MLEITFLGTGTSSGVPMIGCQCSVCKSKNTKDNRLRSSIIIAHNNKKILIDAGTDFRQQLLRENIDSLDAILLTHEHRDHTGGLDDVRALNYITKKGIAIYCEERVAISLKKEYSYAFGEQRYPGAPRMDIHTIDLKRFFIENIEITPIRGYHLNLPVLGYKIDNFAYITDMNYIPTDQMNKIEDLSVLIINAVRKEMHPSHFCLDEAIEIAKKTKAKKCYLTHLSHQIGLHNDLEKELPNGIYVAYDGLKIRTTD